MKTYELSEEFILQAYKAACPDWKQRIEKEVPELFKSKLEVGKWYKVENITVCIKCLYKDEFTVFGVMGERWEDNWTINYNSYYDKYLRLATEEEVKNALIKEAERKYKGKKVRCLHLGKIYDFDILELVYNKDNCLRVKNRCFAFCLFDNGKWAEIIKETTVTQSELEKFYKEQKGIDNLKVVEDENKRI